MDGCETDVQDIGREISVIRLHSKVSSDFTPSRPTREQRLRLFGADWKRPLVPIAWKDEEKKVKRYSTETIVAVIVIIIRINYIERRCCQNVRGTEAAVCSYRVLINGMINCLD